MTTETQTITKLVDLDKRPLSYSSLMAFKQSPAHYIHYLTQKREVTPAFLLGGLVDVLLLTPDQFEERYAVMPESIDKRTKAGKESWEIFTSANPNKTWITKGMHEDATNIVSALNKNPISNTKIMQVERTQSKMEWNCPDTGLPLIGYIDMQAPDFIADLKTTTDAHPDEFMKSAMNWGYHIQCAAYMEAMKVKFGKFPDYYFLVVEKTAPFGVSVLKADADFIKLGKQEFSLLKQEFKFCLENDLWDQTYEFRAAAGYYQMSLPGWAKAKLEK